MKSATFTMAESTGTTANLNNTVWIFCGLPPVEVQNALGVAFDLFYELLPQLFDARLNLSFFNKRLA